MYHNFYCSVVDLSPLCDEIAEETLEDMAMEAAQFLRKKTVYKAAGSYYTVGSLTGITLYQVTLNCSLPSACTCGRSIALGICSHMVAVASDTDKLSEFLNKFHPNNVDTAIYGSAHTHNLGKKPHQKTHRLRRGTKLPSEDVIKVVVVSAKSTKAYKCFGCGLDLKDNSHQPPRDVVLKTCELRSWCPTQEPAYIHAKLSNAFYHFDISCIRRKHPATTINHISLGQNIYLQEVHRNEMDKWG